MTKTKFEGVVGSIRTCLTKHSPEILTGIGIAGMITSTVLAVKATPKAMSLIESEKNRQNRELVREAEANKRNYCPQIDGLKPIDVLKVTWKCYIPTAVTATASIGCLIGASSVNARRNTMLATAYKLSETALSEYKEKVIETIGEKKEKDIRDKIDKDRITKNPVSKNEIIVTEKGNTLCYDHYSRRYFKSDIDKIKRAVNEINKRILHECYVSLNDFYDEIGLPITDFGETLGWNSDGGLIDLHYSSHLNDNGEPCLAIDFDKAPKYDFDKFF